MSGVVQVAFELPKAIELGLMAGDSGFQSGLQGRKTAKMTPRTYTKSRLSRYPDRNGRKEPPCRE